MMLNIIDSSNDNQSDVAMFLVFRPTKHLILCTLRLSLHRSLGHAVGLAVGLALCVLPATVALIALVGRWIPDAVDLSLELLVPVAAIEDWFDH